jgi:hypothetical protein
VLEVEDLASDLELDLPGEDDEELLRIAVGVRLMARRAADLELADEHLEALQRARRQEELAAEHAEGECGTLVAAKHTRPRHGVDLEQVGDRDAESVRDPAQRRDARTRLAALDLAQEALAEA